MDCNAPCGSCGCGSGGICSGSCSGTPCGCARGDCGNRRAGCVGFRYGQCNQNVRCIGPIQCRVVTCIPPWTIDASCSRTVAVDEFTRFHNAPCNHRPFGAFDWVVPAPGGIRIIGWAVDPDVTDPLTLHVYLDGQVVKWVVADLPRPDVAAILPGAGERHGFDVLIPAPVGSHNLTVYAINAGPGTEHPQLISTTVGVGAPFGTVEVITPAPGAIRLVGWVIDPDSAGNLTEVHVYVDGTFAGAFPADKPRPELTQKFVGFGPNHGFDVTIPVAVGDHTVEVWSIDHGVGGAPVKMATKQVTVGGTPIGAFDSATRSPNGVRVVGWALDLDDTNPIEVHFYVDGAYVGQTTANGPRPDVGGVYPSYGANHGFDMEIPALAGDRRVTVYAINRAAGAPYVSLGTLTVRVGDNSFGYLDNVVDDPAGVRVQGWVIDPNSGGPVDVHVYVDGYFAGVGKADRARPDVAGVYPNYGQAHGFDFAVPSPNGPRYVCCYAINIGPGVGNPQIGCKLVTLT
jgi:hypothetical protein